jgi:peptidoglycan/xylan/chitin deacetylase (PgdA/CDA1 family)
MDERVLAVLAYHSVGEPSTGGWHTWFYVAEDAFVDHLRYLRDNEWRVLDLPSVLAGLADPGVLPPRAALLTFDDAYRSMRTVVLPILEEFSYPAVLFVPTGFIGGANSFEPPGWAPEEPICSWDDLRELQTHGVSVQSHSVSHPHFSTLRPEEQQRELTESKEALQAGLSVAVDAFSYPYGDVGANDGRAADALREAGYRMGFLYDDGVNRLAEGVDPYRLSRVAVGRGTDLVVALQPR